MALHARIADALEARGLDRTRNAFMYAVRMGIFVRDAPVRTRRDRQLARRFLRIYPRRTFVTPGGLRNAVDLIGRVDDLRVPGAVVECGVWRGGCAAVMGAELAARAWTRDLWLFDSFEGMPAATPKDGESARGLARGRFDGKLEPVGGLGVDQSKVRKLLFDKFQLDPKRVHIRAGWFQQTLAATSPDIGPIAILRLDGDWYESTLACLDALYDQVSPGGFVILDDYGALPGCRQAVADFFVKRGEEVRIVWVDAWVAYFQRPGGSP